MRATSAYGTLIGGGLAIAITFQLVTATRPVARIVAMPGGPDPAPPLSEGGLWLVAYRRSSTALGTPREVPPPRPGVLP